jgi:hypothetical protein
MGFDISILGTFNQTLHVFPSSFTRSIGVSYLNSDSPTYMSLFFLLHFTFKDLPDGLYSKDDVNMNEIMVQINIMSQDIMELLNISSI